MRPVKNTQRPLITQLLKNDYTEMSFGTRLPRASPSQRPFGSIATLLLVARNDN